MPGVPFWDAGARELVISPNGQSYRWPGYDGKDYSDNPWDLCTLNGFKVPGISVVTCIPRIKLDVAKAIGKDGGPAIDKGHLPADIDIQTTIWTPNQWLIMQAVLIAIWRRPGQAHRFEQTDQGSIRSATTTDARNKVVNKPAVTIAHPSAALYGITSIMIETVGSPEPAPERGARVVRIKAVQYIKPSAKKAERKVAGAGPPIAPEFLQARNGRSPPPSTTDVVPRAAPTPGAAPPPGGGDI
jgi:hypothetical protein